MLANALLALTRVPIGLAALPILVASLTSASGDTNALAQDKILSPRDFHGIQTQVETLRGKKFLHPVPVYLISKKELRAISERDLEKDFPGPKLQAHEALLAWLDFIAPHTSLKTVYGDYSVDQIAGLYDSDAKEMDIPASLSGSAGSGKRSAEKKLEAISSQIEDSTLAHEFTHALEDQYWAIDDPKDHDFKASTDRGTAHSFICEGSATRQMIEVLPAQLSRGSPDSYFAVWNLIHSASGELALNCVLKSSWKKSDALVSGVPETLARSEAMPYSFGYSFCAGAMRKWGLDGLDYVYGHPPASSAQVMHPEKYWVWRQCPVQISLPDNLAGGWTQISLDCVGEADLAVLLGCQIGNLNRGLELARGWDGDHVALYEQTGGHRLVVWASSWASTNAAGRFAGAWLKERQLAHQAVVTSNRNGRIDWESPDGRVGFIRRAGRHLVVLETDQREQMHEAEALVREVTFTEPAEKSVRAAANSPLRRFNPVWSWQKDGDFTVSRSLGGLLSRHDRNSIGKADTLLLGGLAERRRTDSFHKWQVGAGLVAKHESEARRGTTKTTWLPWGVLASHSSARLPQTPDRVITRTSVLWGIAATATATEPGTRSIHILPFGLLFRRATGPGESSTYILGTGPSHHGSTARFRVLGIPLWSSRPGARASCPREQPVQTRGQDARAPRGGDGLVPAFPTSVLKTFVALVRS
ncbi:MAG: hypothetical protein C5B50_25750 [Verrucomicrobia bacterium]|nr:MAG: hypothetical protein C5B50_25750 [Verrucomicrobiota bacterium]